MLTSADIAAQPGPCVAQHRLSMAGMLAYAALDVAVLQGTNFGNGDDRAEHPRLGRGRGTRGPTQAKADFFGAMGARATVYPRVSGRSRH
jgi:hypothetical protein